MLMCKISSGALQPTTTQPGGLAQRNLTKVRERPNVGAIKY